MSERRWRVTKGGWVILAILVACAVLLTVTGGTVRFLAGVVVGVILLALVGDGLAGTGGLTGSKREALMRDRFGSPDDQ